MAESLALIQCPECSWWGRRLAGMVLCKWLWSTWPWWTMYRKVPPPPSAPLRQLLCLPLLHLICVDIRSFHRPLTVKWVMTGDTIPCNNREASQKQVVTFVGLPYETLFSHPSEDVLTIQRCLPDKDVAFQIKTFTIMNEKSIHSFFPFF